ncbi:PBECR2 nuclease fold domain-containing protein [uncultured Ruminococcus sp.]|uniref:PBECR2 nuclease fold domain-containing protein n=1 Tax=uncultured Ruminococcus sp. TaxID=165186 RepID=UPI0025CE0702|nr:PBECR2 nuclease fold domain-containing protein [uncultured Ruminococcus sp.]
MGQKKCGKGHTHQNTIALKAVLRDQGGFLLLCVGIRISENRINKPAVLVDKTAQSDIINTKTTGTAVNDVYSIGKIDVEIYKCVTEDIQTDEVIITERQIEHIKERHPNDFERFGRYFEEIVKYPDFIIEANKPSTALILKEIEINNEKFKTVLRLATSGDDPTYKNSIITFMKIDEKEWNRLIKNKKILYKSE